MSLLFGTRKKSKKRQETKKSEKSHKKKTLNKKTISANSTHKLLNGGSINLDFGSPGN